MAASAAVRPAVAAAAGVAAAPAVAVAVAAAAEGTADRVCRRGGGAPGEGSFTRPMAFYPELTVTNLAPEITMVDPDGEIRRLHADNKPYKDSSGSEVKTRWEAAGLVIETKTPRGQVKETWSIADEPRRLTVLVRMDRPGGGAFTVKRVFDPSEPGAKRSESEP